MMTLTAIFIEIILISAIATIIFTITLLLKPLYNKFQSVKWQNILLKCIVILFLIPIYKVVDITQPTLDTTNYIESNLNNVITNDRPIFNENIQISSAPTKPQVYEQSSTFNIIPILAKIWELGFIVSVFWQIYCYYRFKKSNKFALLVEDEILLNCFDSEKLKLNIVKEIKLYSSENITSPMITGVFLPKIFIPLNWDLEPLVLRHELIHYKHKDLQWKLILTLAKIFHWFNPFIFILGKELQENMEYFCDNIVIENLPIDSKQHYAMTILNSHSNINYGIGFSNSNNNSNSNNYKKLERRFKYMFKLNKKSSVILTGVVVASLLSAFTFASMNANELDTKDLVNTTNNSSNEIISTLYSNRTEFVGDNSKVGNLINNLNFPTDLTYNSFSLQTTTSPLSLTIYFDCTNDVLDYYNRLTEWCELDQAQLLLFSLIGNIEQIEFVLDSGNEKLTLNFLKSHTDSYFGEDIFNLTQTIDGFEKVYNDETIKLPLRLYSQTVQIIADDVSTSDYLLNYYDFNDTDYSYIGETFTQNDKYDKTFELLDIPQNEAEEIISNIYYYEIIDEFDKLNDLFYKNGMVLNAQTMQERLEQGLYNTEFKVNEISTLNKVEAENLINSHSYMKNPFNRDNYENFTYISVDFECKYSDELIALGAQLNEGRHTQIFEVGTIDGDLKIIECFWVSVE